ncbi:sugar phosphate isomerase/epimerase family protein [Gracilibacillus xinjiangensis]|uniref:Sugar phosphate isomerase/epimerase family protein n=1 Tax=Gracilibacillus xinjiangensis TaxID=1193282 RepID=A0ABV8WXR4_9BACI
MKIGLCSVTFREKAVEEVIELAVQAGLESIEWGGDIHVPAGDLENARKVAELTRFHGLQVSSYGSYYKAGESENFDEVVKTAEALGASGIRIWPGNKGSKDADKKYRELVVNDIRRISELAKKVNISIHIEYHGGTLTDTKESARMLMNDIFDDNVWLYWQPSNDVSFEERLASIEAVQEWISNVHIFHWESWDHRYALADGKRYWLAYLSKIMSDGNQRHILIEFVREDSIEQFKQDARQLREWRDYIIGREL